MPAEPKVRPIEVGMAQVLCGKTWKDRQCFVCGSQFQYAKPDGQDRVCTNVAGWAYQVRDKGHMRDNHASSHAFVCLVSPSGKEIALRQKEDCDWQVDRERWWGLLKSATEYKQDDGMRAQFFRIDGDLSIWASLYGVLVTTISVGEVLRTVGQAAEAEGDAEVQKLARQFDDFTRRLRLGWTGAVQLGLEAGLDSARLQWAVRRLCPAARDCV